MRDLVCGDALQILPTLAGDSVDLICTDPPYELTSPNGKGKASGGFMGLAWDATGIAYNVDLWRECLRVLKPGGHAFIMAIPRNYHRVACAVEDAGFIINSPLMHLFSSGFPKSLDISKALDRRAFVEWLDGVPQEELGRLLVESHNDWQIRNNDDPEEMWIDEDWEEHLPELRRKVVSAAVNGEIDANPNLRGRETKTSYQGGLQIPESRKRQDEGARLLADLVARFWDGEGLPPGCRVKVGEKPRGADNVWSAAGRAGEDEGKTTLSAPSTPLAQQWEGWKSPQLKPAFEAILWASKPLSEPTFAENVERWGTGAVNVDAGRIPIDFDADKQGVHYQTSANPLYIGGAKPGDTQMTYDGQGRFPANILASKGCVLPPERMRFFNLDEWSRHHGVLDVPKAARREKEAGLEGLERRKFGQSGGARKALADGKDEYLKDHIGLNVVKEIANDHATVKSVSLMAYLIALGCPPGGLVVDPFMGTGGTLIAAELQGMQYLGIEIDPRWAAIAQKRLEHWERYRGDAPRMEAGVEQGRLWDVQPEG